MEKENLTAVEWLWEQMDDLIIYQRFIHLLEQTKAMEKEQIVETYKYAKAHWSKEDASAENYYNETYKGGNND